MAKYVYVDNSNVWIEGRKVSAVNRDMAYDVWDATNNNILDLSWKYDFGKLLELVGGKKNGLKKACLFGSRPPQNDSLWEATRRDGFEVVVEDRNVQNREKKIDTGIAVRMMEDSYECLEDKNADEMVLVAGDGDYVPVVHNISKRGIRVRCLLLGSRRHRIKRTRRRLCFLEQMYRRDYTRNLTPEITI